MKAAEAIITSTEVVIVSIITPTEPEDFVISPRQWNERIFQKLIYEYNWENKPHLLKYLAIAKIFKWSILVSNANTE